MKIKKRILKPGYFLIISIIVIMVCSYFSPVVRAFDDRYKKAIEEIDSLVKEEMSKNNIPGLSIALVDDKGIIWTRGYGYQDLDDKKSATPETLYLIGSVTKTITATAVMMLVDRGLIELDAPVNEYIPDFNINSRFKETKPITIRQLLSHHSGIRRDIYKNNRGQTPATLDSVVEELKDDYLTELPGTTYKYSNIGYSLLGKVIENVTGVSYGQFVKKEIFQPLGMDNTYPFLDEENKMRLSAGYSSSGLAFIKTHKKIEPVPQRDKPAGAVISSVKDISRFIQLILNNGIDNNGRKLISGEVLNEMFKPQYKYTVMDDEKCGLGWVVNKTSYPYSELNICHGGTQNGFSTLITALPSEKLGIAIFYNANQIFSRYYIANRAMELLLMAKNGIPITDDILENKKSDMDKEEEVIKVDSSDYQKYTGKYIVNFDAPIAVDLISKGGQLTLTMQGQELTLEPLKGKRFRAVKKVLFFKVAVGSFLGYDDIQFDFYQAEDGEVYPRLILKYNDLDMKMLLQKVEPYKIPEYVREYAGEYKLTEESKKDLNDDSFSHLSFRIEYGCAIIDTQFQGTDVSLLVKPLNKKQLVILGSGEIISVGDDKLHYSGLTFEK